MSSGLLYPAALLLEIVGLFAVWNWSRRGGSFAAVILFFIAGSAYP